MAKKTWMMMRLVGLICLWCLLGVPKVGYAQARLVSLEVKDTPIRYYGCWEVSMVKISFIATCKWI